MKTRVIVCPLIKNKNDEYLICKMPEERGAFPGQWGLPGGGMEPGENIFEALKREISEELGNKITFSIIKPWTFRDDKRTKLFPDGSSREIYMIYLIFDCISDNEEIILNDEFEEYKWVKKEDLHKYDLNEATTMTFNQKLK
jgi:nucleoside triphosphatase